MSETAPGRISSQLQHQLIRAGLEVSADQVTRLLYSTDASIYQIMPMGVIWPRDSSQVCAAVEIANQHQVPILPRGGGSSLAGQAIGQALILDFSRWMDQVLELIPEEKKVKVQPGLVLGSLNRQLKTHGLSFGPDPASADRATLGGVLGNNATGAHSILYGMAHDHLLETELVLSDGSQANFQALGPDQLQSKAGGSSLESRILAQLPGLIDGYRDAINNDYPSTFRNVAGYNLNILASQGKDFNPAPLLAGSEGTLGVMTSATLNLVSLPEYTALYLVHFQDLKACLEAVPAILELEPSAVELIDHILLELTRANPAFKDLLAPIQGYPAAVLAVEFQSDEAAAVSGKESYLSKFGPTVPLLEARDQADFWKARKVGLGILQSRRQDIKPTGFIEDAAVPVENLAEYVMEIKAFTDQLGMPETALYAHASAGCLHIRPQLNLKSARGVEQMRQVAEKSLELVLRLGGTTSGEHGEGLARGEFSAALYGPTLTRAFREVKGLFDPENQLNPGKLIDPPPMDSRHLLRYGPDYKAINVPPHTMIRFEEDQGFDRAVEMCNGAGVCRQLDDGVMCPTFKATRDETHSTRGRANMLRAALTGKLGPDGLTSNELYQVLDLCLSCQACASECPSSVDMSKLKAEFLGHYYQAHGMPFRNWFFANIGGVSRLAQPFAPVLNPLLKSPLGRALAWIGIHPDRQLPAFANQSFTSWYRKTHGTTNQDMEQGAVFFHDTYLEYNYPHIGKALVDIFQKAGLELIVLENKVDSGRPAYSKGALEISRKLAAKNLELLKPYAEKGLPILGCEPSVVAMLRNEYQDLHPGPTSKMVSQRVSLAADYLVEAISSGKAHFNFDEQPRRILYHGHCQQKSHFGTTSTLKLLQSIPNAEVEEIEGTCCGMAGAFGYEKEHYQLSIEIAELGLAPQIRASAPETIISASGTSCREQIIHTTQREPLHPLEVFAAALV